MSDDLLLTLLWLLPLAGAALVLCLPKNWAGIIRWCALAITIATFVLTLVAYSTYVSDARANSPLRDRAAQNAAVNLGALAEQSSARETQAGEFDLVARHNWIPYFNIQYFLGLDG